MLLSVLAVWLALLQACAVAWQPDAVLELFEQEIDADCTPRLSTVVNGTSPGPILRFKADQHLFIRAHNRHETQNATVHWHGLSQFMAPFSDGTPLTAQWPIAPGQWFDYEFMLAEESVGTYFYHSHIGLQTVTAYGAFIVDEPDGKSPPYAYDDERVLMLGDYYHANDTSIIAGLQADPFMWLNEPQTLLINGKGISKPCNASALLSDQTCSTNCSYGVTTVDPGKTYRIRVIGATILSYMSLAFEGHGNMSLIEADAGYLTSYNVSHIEVASGQRYSFLLTTKSADEVASDRSNGSYWIAMQTRWRPLKTSGYGILAYSSQPAPAPVNTPAANVTSGVVLPNETFGWITDALSPLSKLDINGLGYPTASEVTRRVILTSQQVGWFASKNGSRWEVDGQLIDDGAVYSNDSVSTYPTPFLVQLYEKSYSPNYTYAYANNGRDTNGVYPARLGEVLEIVIRNEAGSTGQAEAHPWHAHGQHYWFIANGQGNWSAEATEAIIANKTGSPFLRDSTTVYPGPDASYLGTSAAGKVGDLAGWAVWRLRVVTAGSWLYHCHLTPHMTMGMQTIWVYGAEDLPALPADYGNNYLQYNQSSQATPKSYFKPSR